ncbi:MAG: hypothetical protein WC729_28815 [Sphingomonas sp.]|jgi:hypothetical protein|uniref:hypothetical protein n=1 Tax=Sphingomonas sp. TaxID=28214 RepID=UPI003562A15A
MAVDPGGPRLAQIARVRGLRLSRAAADALAAAEEAAAALDRARADHAAAIAARAEARQAFTRTPACSQARLWLDHSIALEAGAAAYVAERHMRLDLARDAHGEAFRAVGRHQLRSDTIADHRRAAIRVEQRRVEDRLEADMPMTVRSHMS